MVVMSLNVRQSAIILLIPTLPTISMPRSPSPTASARIRRASSSSSFSVCLTIMLSPIIGYAWGWIILLLVVEFEVCNKDVY